MTAYREQRNFALTALEKIQMRQAMAILAGTGYTLEDAARIAAEAKNLPTRCTVSDAVLRFFADRKARDLRATTAAWYVSRLDALTDAHGARFLGDITRQELEAVAASPGRADSTVRSYYRAFRALWRWARDQHPPLCAEDVTRGMSVTPKRVDHHVEFLPVADAKRIMQNCAPKFRPAAALLLFAGLRPHELWGAGKVPMRWDCIDLDERIVRVGAEHSKTRSPRILEGLPDNLWEWIGDKKRVPDQPICPAQSQWLIRHIQFAGGFMAKPTSRGESIKVLRPYPADATRHSFATYHVALHNQPGRTALLLGHRSEVMLYKHYRGLARKADAAAYFAITPATV